MFPSSLEWPKCLWNFTHGKGCGLPFWITAAMIGVIPVVVRPQIAAVAVGVHVPPLRNVATSHGGSSPWLESGCCFSSLFEFILDYIIIRVVWIWVVLGESLNGMRGNSIVHIILVFCFSFLSNGCSLIFLVCWFSIFIVSSCLFGFLMFGISSCSFTLDGGCVLNLNYIWMLWKKMMIQFRKVLA